MSFIISSELESYVEENILEASVNGEQAASKTVAPEGVEGSNPSASAEPVKNDPIASAPDPTIRYRLSLYDRRGNIKTDIPAAIVYDAGARWGDIIRQIPSQQGSTVDEIVEAVWDYERRHKFRKTPDRTRAQIESAIRDLAEKSIIHII